MDLQVLLMKRVLTHIFLKICFLISIVTHVWRRDNCPPGARFSMKGKRTRNSYFLSVKGNTTHHLVFCSLEILLVCENLDKRKSCE